MVFAEFRLAPILLTLRGCLAAPRASVSSDRSAQRGSRSQARVKISIEKEFCSLAAVRFLRRRAHSAMTGTGASSEIAERPLATPSNISPRMGRDVRIRYSTVAAVPSSTSGDLSSGKLLR